MAIVSRVRRQLWIALAAITVSLPATARAYDGARCEFMLAGCTACHCCTADAPAVATTAVVPVPSAIGSTSDRPGPCSCCTPSPAAPAPRQEQRAEEQRTDNGRGVAAMSSVEPGPRVPVAIAFVPDVGPPRSPIYLRTARLLI
jgi:hypothetical protein